MILPAVALAILTVIRLAIAGSTPLAPDEAYYWIWSKALSAGYLDHPPMVALWIRFGTAIAGDTAFGVRLFGPPAAALGTWMVVDATNRLFPAQRTGIWAGALLNATLLVGIGSILMTPDAPLLFFWTVTLWAAIRLSTSSDWRWWLVAAAAAGLALASKYTAVFLWGGIGLWLLLTPTQRRWLRHPAPWCGAILGLLLFAPVMLWNAVHDWAGFLRQSGRVGNWQPERAAQFLGEFIGGQAGLATPLVWLLCLAGIAVAIHHAWRRRNAGWTLLACLTLPPILVFLQHAVGDRVQGNWPGIVYPAAVIAAARLGGMPWRVLRWPAVTLGYGVTTLVYMHALTGALPIPTRLDPIALQLAGWQGMAAQLDERARAVDATFVAAEQYALAAELAWALPRDRVVIGVEERWRHFDLPSPRIGGRTGLLVRDARGDDPFDPNLWSTVQLIGEVSRPGADRSYRLYRVTAGDLYRQAVILPRPDR